MNAFAVVPAGSPASSSTFRTDVAETGMPRPLSSPTIRLYPQGGFSLERRRIGSRSERPSCGRPGLRCWYVHRRAISCRCQRSSVSGLKEKTVQAGRGNERLSDASSARSARVNCGRVDCRRRITSSWRRTRISTSFERRGRPSSHTRANRFRTTRYTSDQSMQPPSTTTRAPNLTSSTLRRTADEFANPTGDDSINGGPGTDICIGGPGTDTFNNCETQIQ